MSGFSSVKLVLKKVKINLRNTQLCFDKVLLIYKVIEQNVLA